MAVVMELDKTLFEGYIKSKSDVVRTIVRGGILDSQMDWYETPQPTGMFFQVYPRRFKLPQRRQMQKFVLTCMRH